MGFEHLNNTLLTVSADLFLGLFIERAHIDRFPILQDHMLAVQPWKVIFKYFGSSGNCHWNNFTTGFLGDFEAAFFKRTEAESLLSLLRVPSG